MKKIFKITAYMLLSIFCIAFLYYISLVIIFNVEVKNEFEYQQQRIAELKQNPNPPINESNFANFDIYDNDLRLNEIQFLATHNSFKAMPSMYWSKFAEIFWGQKVRNGYYGLPYLTEQLDMGYRGLELDIALYDGDFVLTHNPTTDWRTNGPDFRLALEEIKLWSDINQGHIPLNLMIQVRDTWAPYSHRFSAFKKQDLIKLDNLLKEIFGEEGIIKPADVIGDNNTLREAVENDGWPLLTDSMGKVFFSILFDQQKNLDYYVDIDPTFATQSSFVFTRPSAEITAYTAMILADNPFEEGVEEMVGKNYILRTRIDEQFEFSEERRQASIELGSVILATDYPVGNLFPCNYVAKLTEDNKTIIQRGSVTFD